MKFSMDRRLPWSNNSGRCFLAHGQVQPYLSAEVVPRGIERQVWGPMLGAQWFYSAYYLLISHGAQRGIQWV